ncbi:MAG: 2-oxoglutarate and iron-dependent oxygenase domain-containing protein, partial [Actinomycetota bacterium]
MTNATPNGGADEFDAAAKERQLRSQADGWDTSAPVPAEPGDIPTVDVGPWFASGERAHLEAAADVLRDACERVGFHQLIGHGISPTAIDDAFATVRGFHALPLEVKRTIVMDRPDHPLGGVGYLPVGERKLPRRAVGNRNEAFLLKGDRGVGFDQNQWPAETDAPGFRAGVERYATAVTDLARRLLPVYATALDLPPDFFDEGFQHPFWRLRMTHYPPDDPSIDAALDVEEGIDGEQRAYGIAPHVDTTFFTLLLQDSPGLTIYSADRDRWIDVPVVPGAF